MEGGADVTIHEATERYDVVVLGSGAAGLTAAVTAADAGASVGLFEKADLIGGTAAMSGGIIWMPNNHHQEAAGIADSRQDALAYLESLSLGQIDSDMAATFVDEGPQMLRWIEDNTPCAFHLVDGYPDYHPEHPGGLPGGGRSLDNALFAFPELGEWAGRIRNQRGAHPVMLTDTPLGGATAMPAPEVLGERIAAGLHGMGLGLVGALLKACLDRGIEPVLDARAAQLLVEDKRVHGVVFDTPDGRRSVAAGAVIVATGGFEWNDELVRTFLRGPMTAPAGAPTNTGDGLRHGHGRRGPSGQHAQRLVGTGGPGARRAGMGCTLGASRSCSSAPALASLMVNGQGVRFTNEAGNYNAMGGAFHAFDPSTFTYPNQPCWLVFDHAHKQRYDVAGCPPGDDVPDWMVTGDTPEELASAMGVPADALAATIARFNDHAAHGEDPDFGRGTERLRHLQRRPLAAGRRRHTAPARHRRRSTPFGSRADRSAPTVDPRPTPAAGSSPSTAASSTACTRPGTSWPHPPAWSTAAPAARWGRR